MPSISALARLPDGMSTTAIQILVVTAGKAKVATDAEEREITVGDIVHIKAGERHWHGATAKAPMSHITVTTAGSTSKH
jgi:quercetin dioxygenase-like cupin family protein